MRRCQARKIFRYLVIQRQLAAFLLEQERSCRKLLTDRPDGVACVCSGRQGRSDLRVAETLRVNQAAVLHETPAVPKAANVEAILSSNPAPNPASKPAAACACNVRAHIAATHSAPRLLTKPSRVLTAALPERL